MNRILVFALPVALLYALMALYVIRKWPHRRIVLSLREMLCGVFALGMVNLGLTALLEVETDESRLAWLTYFNAHLLGTFFCLKRGAVGWVVPWIVGPFLAAVFIAAFGFLSLMLGWYLGVWNK
ncbi:MAG TPA: hypothetical protein VEJ63_02820 [Planctomycetota bacterium]|nr:hypothetical protein [Planctomycetota bacterium]